MAMSRDSEFSSLPAPRFDCGDIEIQYPFGVRGGAPAAWRDFEVGYDGGCPTLALVGGGAQLRIIEISLDGFVRILAGPIAEQFCGGGPSITSDTVTQSSGWINLEGTHFTFSSRMNNLTVIGCDALSMIQLSGSSKYASGCMAFCESDDGWLDPSCSGMGCCQAPIPRGLLQGGFNLKLRSIANATGDMGIANSYNGNCSRAFLMQGDALTLSNYTMKSSAFPLVLEWVIGTQTCAQSKGSANYACKDHTQCFDLLGVGYRCQCLKGFSGNPYLGCEDIRECKDPKTHDCIEHCIEEPGSYRCTCPKGMIGDGRRFGSGCTKRQENLLKVYIDFAGTREIDGYFEIIDDFEEDDQEISGQGEDA